MTVIGPAPAEWGFVVIVTVLIVPWELEPQPAASSARAASMGMRELHRFSILE